MKDALQLIEHTDTQARSQQLSGKPYPTIELWLDEWECISEHIQYLQEVEAYHDKVMDVLSDMPIDIDDIIEGQK